MRTNGIYYRVWVWIRRAALYLSFGAIPPLQYLNLMTMMPWSRCSRTTQSRNMKWPSLLYLLVCSIPALIIKINLMFFFNNVYERACANYNYYSIVRARANLNSGIVPFIWAASLFFTSTMYVHWVDVSVEFLTFGDVTSQWSCEQSYHSW